MKRHFFFVFMLIALCCARDSYAQCSFTPTVTPANLIMCPNDADTIWTQVYDSYQWYKAGQPIAGATQQYYIADYFQDAGSYFKVEATLGGCTEMSDSVMVDGWAFLPPFVISYGDMSLCPDVADSVIFQLGQPYTEHIQWFNNGVPIPGANDDSLIVYAPGIYTVEGSPSVCLNYVASLGVPLDVNYYYTTPQVAPDSISLCGGSTDTVSSTDFATTYQWYRNGTLVQDSIISYLIVNSAGSYNLVIAHDDSTCLISSDTIAVQVYQPAAITIIEAAGVLVAASTPTVVTGYQWYLNGSAITGATNGSYTPTQDGMYTVTAMDSFCVITAPNYNYTTTDIDDVRGIQVSISPNPFSSEILVNAKVPVMVAVYSIDGKKLVQAEGQRSINVERLNAGMYIITVSDSKGHVLKKEKMVKRR